MAIFSGTWKDDDGVPFADHAFQVREHDGGGSCQKLTTMRKLPGSVARAKTTYYLLRRTWYLTLTVAQRHAWWLFVRETQFRVRHGIYFRDATMAGYMACNFTQEHYHCMRREAGPVWPLLPNWGVTAAWYNPHKHTIRTSYYQNDWPEAGYYDGIAVYQFNPLFIGKTGAWKHTHIVAYAYKFPWTQPFCDIEGPARWPQYPGIAGLVMVRIWRSDHHDIHLAPIGYEDP